MVWMSSPFEEMSSPFEDEGWFPLNPFEDEEPLECGLEDPEYCESCH